MATSYPHSRVEDLPLPIVRQEIEYPKAKKRYTGILAPVPTECIPWQPRDTPGLLREYSTVNNQPFPFQDLGRWIDTAVVLNPTDTLTDGTPEWGHIRDQDGLVNLNRMQSYNSTGLYVYVKPVSIDVGRQLPLAVTVGTCSLVKIGHGYGIDINLEDTASVDYTKYKPLPPEHRGERLDYSVLDAYLIEPTRMRMVILTEWLMEQESVFADIPEVQSGIQILLGTLGED